MSDALTQLAQRLGREVADSPQARSLREAKEAVRSDADLHQTFQSFNEQTAKIQKAIQANEPIEVSDKKRLEELHGKLIGSQEFKQFTAAQVEYTALMRSVVDAMGQQLAETEKPL